MLGIALLGALVLSGACGAADPIQPQALRRAPGPTWDAGVSATTPTTMPDGPAAVSALPGDGGGGGAAGGGRIVRASPGGPIVTGRIEIPKIGLDHLTYEGNTLAQIDHGPSHWPGTPMPGHVGNTVFPGHRITHTHPFYFIDALVPGDSIIFTTAEGRFVYEVYQSVVVRPNETWVVDPTPDAIVTIFGCHPRGSARFRYVVRGRLVSAPAPQRAAAPPPRSQPAPPPPPPQAPPSTQPARPPATTTTTRPACVICLP
ncbi:MAG: sortase [Actinomycetota bacterium]|nr:sortase [Actinomycetota bacterium]